MKNNAFGKSLGSLKFLVLAMALMMGFLIRSEVSAYSVANMKAYTISSGNTAVYDSTSLSTKIGTIYGTDEVTILAGYSNGTYKVSYPTSRGSKQGYIPKSAIVVQTNGTNKVALQKITTYKRPGGASYGYIAKDDIVLMMGSRSGYTQVRYPAGSVCKFAWIRNEQTSSRTDLSYALYKNSSAYISCGFDGYTSTAGRHEGIDIRCGNGKPVYALTDGVVTSVVRGSTGKDGLSTIAVYQESTNRTVIYLHSAPVSLSVGQKISRGQQIATESWRGCSSSSGSHTHVEVRNGRQTRACKSLNDYTLENSNPASFWNSQGYNVK